MSILIEPITITAPKSELNSRRDYRKLKQYSDLYTAGGIQYLDIPYKYRSHIREDIHNARDSFDKAVQAEKERYENSSTGKFTNFMGQVVTAPMVLPALQISAPILHDAVEPVAQVGNKYVVEPVKNYLSQHPLINEFAQGLGYTADAVGTAYGLGNLFGPEGGDKTTRKFNDGNLAGAAGSGLGDLADASGFGGAIDFAAKGYKGFRGMFDSVLNTHNKWRINRVRRRINRDIKRLVDAYEPFDLDILPEFSTADNPINARVYVPDATDMSHADSGLTPLQLRAKKEISFHPDVRSLSDEDLQLILMEFDPNDENMLNRRVELLDRLRVEYPELHVPGDKDDLAGFQHDFYINRFVDELNLLNLSDNDNLVRDNIISEVRRDNKVLPTHLRTARELVDKIGGTMPEEFMHTAADDVRKKAVSTGQDIPRGSGLLEQNTSIDSEALKAMFAARYGGTGPNTARVHVTNWFGFRNGLQKIHFSKQNLPEHLQKYYDMDGNSLPIDVQNELTEGSRLRANEALKPLRRGGKNMIDKGLVTLPEGISLNRLIDFYYGHANTVPSHIDPKFHSPNFQVFKQLKGGKLKK